MDPSTLVLVAVLGTFAALALAAGAGWVARSREADARAALQQHLIDSMARAIQEAEADASRAREAAGPVLDAARRAAADPGGDPLGLGLLLAEPDAGEPSAPPAGEATAG